MRGMAFDKAKWDFRYHKERQYIIKYFLMKDVLSKVVFKSKLNLKHVNHSP